MIDARFPRASDLRKPFTTWILKVAEH